MAIRESGFGAAMRGAESITVGLVGTLGSEYGRRVRLAVWAGSVLLVAIALLFAPRIAAASATLHYEADSSCPAAVDFVGRLRRHAPTVAVRLVARAPFDVGIGIQREESAYAGRLEMLRAGRRFVRKINASSCDELTAVLAFVVGLSLTGNSPPEPDRAWDVGHSKDAELLTMERETEDSGEESSNRDSTTAEWRVWTGARGVVTSVTAPGWAIGESVFVDLHAPRARKFASTIRIGFVHLQPRTDVVGAWSVRTTSLAGRVEASPLRLRLGGATDLRVAAGVDIGSLAVQTRRTATENDVSERSVVLLDEFFGLRLEVRPATWVSLELQVELALPITRHNFPLDSTIGFQVPPVAGSAVAGIAWRVW